MTIELIPLAKATLTLGKPTMIPKGPRGTRVTVSIDAAEWDGERLKATQASGPAGDWALIGSDGTLFVDVRASLQTHDGALIHVSYNGRADYSTGRPAAIYGAPTFETSDPRYLWLNKIQAIAKAVPSADGSRLEYEVYEAR